MTTFRSTAEDTAELLALEHQFPFARTLISLLATVNVLSVVTMLLAQA